MPTVTYVFYIINSIFFISIIILDRRKPERTISWLLLFILMPPLGSILYIFTGINWKKRRLSSDDNIGKESFYSIICDRKEEEYKKLMMLLKNISNSPVFENNNVKIFKDGKEKFKVLKKELIRAQKFIHLEYYIVKNDKIGNEIKDILICKARKGIEVKFIIDRVGSAKLSKKYIQDLKKAGVEVLFYNYLLAPFFKLINTQINYRNHRKIIVIDGKVGFIGGINIGDEYLGKGRLGYWRDTHLMIKGDSVLGLESVFMDDYSKIIKADRGKQKHNYKMDKYFPDYKNGKSAIQIIKSGPDSKNPAIMLAIISMIFSAKDHIYITTPYFVPNDSVLNAIKTASLSGVDVRILFPGRYDHFHVYYASRTYLRELAKDGVKVYFYDKESFVHAKVMCVDSKICTVGSTNMDIRSYELNYEVNAVIYDKDVTVNLEKQFFYDIKKSIRVDETDFKKSSVFTKILESIVRIFSNIL